MDAGIMTLAGTPGWAALYTERLPAATSPAGIPTKTAALAAVGVVGYAASTTKIRNSPTPSSSAATPSAQSSH